ncbi:unnamed protein product [Closterium sp. Naga37s-1]|nr:unnamed protein product [Closterium sp. Naga37s-1]
MRNSVSAAFAVSPSSALSAISAASAASAASAVSPSPFSPPSLFSLQPRATNASARLVQALPQVCVGSGLRGNGPMGPRLSHIRFSSAPPSLALPLLSLLDSQPRFAHLEHLNLKIASAPLPSLGSYSVPPSATRCSALFLTLSPLEPPATIRSPGASQSGVRPANHRRGSAAAGGEGGCVRPLVSLNLNACQQVTDQGVTTAAKLLTNLRSFSLYWNLRVTDSGVKQVVLRCSSLQSLNLSGCKNITDSSLRFISTSLPHLKSLNLTRCVQATDTGLKHITAGCTQLEELLLYALSSFTDESLATIGQLSHLRVLDLCGMKHLTDQGLEGISRCSNLISLNLSWCVLITDQGLIKLASSCHDLELLSLHGIRGVTDAAMSALSASSRTSLQTLDVNGSVGIQGRSHDQLNLLFPRLTCFTVHK